MANKFPSEAAASAVEPDVENHNPRRGEAYGSHAEVRKLSFQKSRYLLGAIPLSDGIQTWIFLDSQARAVSVIPKRFNSRGFPHSMSVHFILESVHFFYNF